MLGALKRYAVGCRARGVCGGNWDGNAAQVQALRVRVKSLLDRGKFETIFVLVC